MKTTEISIIYLDLPFAQGPILFIASAIWVARAHEATLRAPNSNFIKQFCVNAVLRVYAAASHGGINGFWNQWVLQSFGSRRIEGIIKSTGTMKIPFLGLCLLCVSKNSSKNKRTAFEPIRNELISFERIQRNPKSNREIRLIYNVKLAICLNSVTIIVIY